MEDEFIRAASLADLPPGTLLGVVIGETRLCLANADGEVYAIRDVCSHRDFPLSTGTIEDDAVECSWHGAKFDLKTGRAVCLPAIKPVVTYRVEVRDGDIFVSVQ